MVAFEQGEIDFTEVSPDTLDRFTSDPDIRIIQQPAFWGYQFYFNMNKRAELNDKTIRHAFAYAIDRDELVEKIERGAGKPGQMAYFLKTISGITLTSRPMNTARKRPGNCLIKLDGLIQMVTEYVTRMEKNYHMCCLLPASAGTRLLSLLEMEKNYHMCCLLPVVKFVLVSL
jgi:ABC-type transport system substrate-binding protein